jgi:hypothetical protein
MRYVRHALSYTFASLGGWALLFSLLAIPAVGFVLHRWIAGSAAMNAEFQVWLVYGLAATGIVFLSLFAFNLACAPYRIERDSHKKTVLERDALQSQAVRRNTQRTLTAEHQGILSDGIRSSKIRPTAIHVVYNPISEESANFADNIGDAIRAAGIESVVHDGPLYTHNGKDRGIKIMYSKDNLVLEELAVAIQATLKDIGFNSEKRPIETSADSLWIYVARSSDAD